MAINNYPDDSEPNRWAQQSPIHDGGIPHSGEGGQASPAYTNIDPKTGQSNPMSNYTPTQGAGGGGGAPAGAGGGAASGSAAGAAAATYAGMTIPQWLQSILGIYGAIQGSKPGKFQQVPEDPSQTAARNKLLGYVDNSPTRDMLTSLMQQRLSQAHGFELPKGVNGYDASPAPANGGYDLSKIFASTQPAATQKADPGTVQQFIRSSDILKFGRDAAAGAVATKFNIPFDEAARYVAQAV